MDCKPLALPEVLLLTPNVLHDARGFFFESFRQQHFNQMVGQEVTFVQDNHSHSVRGALRGLHYQLPPKAQGKLVRVVVGEIFDVAVDIRPQSPRFGQWVSAILSAENHQQLWIPRGFAHGFLALSKTADVAYKITEEYTPERERRIRWDDPHIGITWPISQPPLLSEDDHTAPLLSAAEY